MGSGQGLSARDAAVQAALSKPSPVPGEFELIAAIARWVGEAGAATAPGDLVRGIGDDTAVIAWGDRWMLLTVDALVEGVHFRRDWMTLEDVGYRAAAVNLSDVAAMGGRPRFALLSLGLPGNFTEPEAAALYRGLHAALTGAGAVVVGGNVAGSPERLFVDLTLVGEAPEGRVLWRHTARPGDRLLVTGWVGRAAAGRWVLETGARPAGWEALVAAYRRPQPRLAEGQAAVQAGGGRVAGLDLSDGLAGDLRRLAEASGVGVLLDTARLPVDEATRRAARAAGVDGVAWAVGGGEDYELLLAVHPEAAEAVSRAVAAAGGLPVTDIGEARPAADGLTWLRDGRRQPLPEGGWDHLRPPGRC